jgi:porin
VQPDIQYVYRPAGGVESPARPGTLLRGGMVFGFRSTMTY